MQVGPQHGLRGEHTQIVAVDTELAFLQPMMMRRGKKSAEGIGVAGVERPQHRTVHRLDEQPPQVAMQRDLGRIIADRVNNRVRHRRRLAGADRVEHFLARTPVQIDRAFTDTGATGQFIDGHPAIAPRQQQLAGGIKNPIGPFSPIAAGAFHHHASHLMTRIRF